MFSNIATIGSDFSRSAEDWTVSEGGMETPLKYDGMNRLIAVQSTSGGAAVFLAPRKAINGFKER